MPRRICCSVAALVFALAGAYVAAAPASAQSPATTACPLPTFGPGKDYHPQIDAATFTSHVTNPLFPLTPGTTLVYSGTKDRKRALDLVVPSTHTKVIDGVRTRIVEDRLYLNNVLEERTSDYYAQDHCGNVWYFGEDTAELDSHGKVVNTEGSFHAGVDGAQPGVFMQATPEVGRKFRQEWYAGQAEDTFSVLKLSTPVTVPAGAFKDALQTKETTALEPGVVDNKYYGHGIGELEEVTVKGPTEKLVLVEVIS